MGYSAVSVFGDILSAMGRGISRKKKKRICRSSDILEKIWAQVVDLQGRVLFVLEILLDTYLCI